MPQIYNYKSPEVYLQDQWLIKKEKNPQFSLRSWAKILGMNNHSLLQQMLNGKKKIPKKYIPRLIKSLELNEEQGFFLEALVDVQRAVSIDEKNFYANKLKALIPNKQVYFKEVEVYQYLKDPLHILLVEMINLYDFQKDPNWIKKRIVFKCSTEQIIDATQRLLDLKIIEEIDGKLSCKDLNLTSPHDVKNKAVQEFHRAISYLAGDLISQQAVNEREYNSYALNINKKNIPKAKKIIRKFVGEFISQMEELNQKKAEDTYQLNVQFFKLTKQDSNSGD